MFFIADRGETVFHTDGSTAQKVVILSDTDISTDTVEITGADVDGMASGEIISRASVLIAPNANFIAFSDGVFKKKG